MCNKSIGIILKGYFPYVTLTHKFGAMRTVKPERLKKGDTIAIISPASPLLTVEHYKKGKKILEKMGYRVIASKYVHNRHLLFAGDAQTRAQNINDVFSDTSVQAIMCVRGGSGTSHILPFVNFSIIQKNPKIFIGYSDITALQIAIFNKTGLVTFYGPMMATDIGKGFTSYKMEQLLKVITEAREPFELKNPSKKRMQTIYPGEAKGKLMGGCLSIVAASLGTGYEIDTRDKILFFEDIDEKPHRIDRYLTQLIQARKLEGVKGIIFGTFHRCNYTKKDTYYRFGVTMLDIIRERITALAIPSIYGLQFGHVVNKLTIPQGVNATLDASEGRLFIEPAVI